MRHGFIKAAAVTPGVKVGDPVYNAEVICTRMQEAALNGAQIIVFPELCLTGYTCDDLFLQEHLLNEAEAQLMKIAGCSAELDALVFIGLPFEYRNKLYNVAAVIHAGEVLAFIPKVNIPSYAEFYEGRHFAPGNREAVLCDFAGGRIPFGANILFEADAVKGLAVGCEICEDFWVPNPPGTDHAMAGAVVLANLSASNETIGKDTYREMLVTSASARLICAYVYASAGEGESTQDAVFSGHNIIAENGTVLVQSRKFICETVYADLDIYRLRAERRRMTSFQSSAGKQYLTIPFRLEQREIQLERIYERTPFISSKHDEDIRRCEEVLLIQAYGLKKRFEHTGAKKAVIGVSGGLDSTLALLAAVKAFDLLGFDRKNVLAVTMPCFGTTGRTYENACTLVRALSVELREVNIKETVSMHFKDIGQDISKHDVTYENAQARERTQVLMDIANQEGGLVIGTGDMSELALGWATYNGDHMSMYGVNAGVPKTLVRRLVEYYAGGEVSLELKGVLEDVLDTPVSPELLPHEDGMIAQVTEDIVGPYELHDFFLYYMLRCGFEPGKIYRIAKLSFKGLYEEETILKWLKVFYRRFFSQQFKRSCLPDGPKIGSVSLSPRGDFRMPSDACGRIWLDQIELL